MGAGGSIETEGGGLSFGSFSAGTSRTSTNPPRFYCHSCHQIFQVSPQHQEVNPVYNCVICNSSFIEEYSPIVQTSHFRRHQLEQDSQGGAGHLTQEQSRRMTNATIMLRLLESQLREELQQLQAAFEQANARQQQAEAAVQKQFAKLTAAMKVKLRQSEMTLDTICSQPSCPICSEDFAVGCRECKLPCSHIFHRDCVIPWLELKKTCPICRSELTDSIPEVTELLGFEMNEIEEKLREVGVEIPDFHQRAKHDMANLLHRKIHDQKEKELEQRLLFGGDPLASSNSANSNIGDSEFFRVLNMPFLSMSLAGMGGFGGEMPQISATIRSVREDEEDEEDQDAEPDQSTRGILATPRSDEHRFFVPSRPELLTSTTTHVSSDASGDGQA